MCHGGYQISPSKLIKILLILAFVAMIAMCRASVANHQKSMKAADVAGLEIAFSLREYVIENQACPDKLSTLSDSQTNQEGRNFVLRGNENQKFYIYYRCNPDLSYSVIVSYSFDSQKYFAKSNSGNIEITYGHHTEPQRAYIANRSEIVSVIESLYE